jgi:hypothetical protein
MEYLNLKTLHITHDIIPDFPRKSVQKDDIWLPKLGETKNYQKS